MAKYYIQSGWVRLVLDARTPGHAAERAIQWCHDRQAEILREPADDRIREAEVVQWQLGEQMTVSETGFGGSAGEVFQTAALSELPRLPRRCAGQMVRSDR